MEHELTIYGHGGDIREASHVGVELPFLVFLCFSEVKAKG